jgi:putative DNA primase/helicase
MSSSPESNLAKHGVFELSKAKTAKRAGTGAGRVTEDSVALQFAERYAGRLLYCHDAGSWYLWTGSHWKLERTGLALEWAREQARELAKRESTGRLAPSKASFAKGVELFAQVDRTFAVTSEVFDTDPFLLGTPSGTVDLRHGNLRPANPDDRITKITAVSPADTAECERWLRFLDETTGSDEGLVRFLQQLAGYILTGDIREHALFFIYGPGGNGKSVFLNVLTGMMASYAATAPMGSFTASNWERHPTDLAMLCGKRLVTASETEDGHRWAEARIKQMTGGDRITARYMRRDNFTFIPQFKLIIVGNHKPVLQSIDDAIKRRFHIIPFTKKPDHPDPELEQKLKGEAPGILRWAISGCLDWHGQSQGLIPPDAVCTATEQYLADQDVLGQWLTDHCDVESDNPHKWEATRSLFESWSKYADKAGEIPGSKKAFSAAMQNRGFRPDRKDRGTIRVFLGLRLKQARAMTDDGC